MLSIKATSYLLLDKKLHAKPRSLIQVLLYLIWDYSIFSAWIMGLLFCNIWYWKPLKKYFCGNGALALPFSILWFCWKVVRLKSVIPHAFVYAKSEMCNVLFWESMCKWTEFLCCVSVYAVVCWMTCCLSTIKKKKKVQLFFLLHSFE